MLGEILKKFVRGVTPKTMLLLSPSKLVEFILASWLNLFWQVG
jgi:hypothetical protein